MYNVLIIKQYGVISKEIRNPSAHQKTHFRTSRLFAGINVQKEKSGKYTQHMRYIFLLYPSDFSQKDFGKAADCQIGTFVYLLRQQ